MTITRDLCIAILAGAAAGYLLANLSLALWSIAL